MNIPDNNPYSDPSPANDNNPNARNIANTDKGTILSGFFLGWGLMIAGAMFSGFLISMVSGFVSGTSSYDSFLFQTTISLSLAMPLLIIIACMIWFGKKGKSKIVKGIGAAVLSLIALVLLLVAACFGLFAMNGGGFH
jgi:hypothetical protein